MPKIEVKELAPIFVGALIIGFVLSFRDWGSETLDVAAGLSSLLLSTIIALCVIVIRLLIQKWLALREGYIITLTFHKWGLVASIFLAFFTSGFVPYVTPGELKVQMSKRLRLGAYRYGLNHGDIAKLAVAGSLFSVLLMILVKPLAFAFPESFLIYKLVQVNAAIAFCSLMPLPGSDGFWLLYHKRALWVFVIAFVGLYFFLILQVMVFSYVLAVVLAILVTFIFKKWFD